MTYFILNECAYIVYYCYYNFFKVGTSQANANKNQLTNIKTFIKEKTNK